MKLSSLILATHILFGAIILILLIRVIFFGSCWIWVLFNLMIWVNTWASLERTKEERKLKKEIEMLKKTKGAFQTE